jgi:hypothetical protein
MSKLDTFGGCPSRHIQANTPTPSKGPTNGWMSKCTGKAISGCPNPDQNARGRRSVGVQTRTSKPAPNPQEVEGRANRWVSKRKDGKVPIGGCPNQKGEVRDAPVGGCPAATGSRWVSSGEGKADPRSTVDGYRDAVTWPCGGVCCRTA